MLGLVGNRIFVREKPEETICYTGSSIFCLKFAGYYISNVPIVKVSNCSQLKD